jgi:asparagine synthase (glutamine-hydrolysing)
VKKYPNIQPFYFSPNDQQIADSFHRVAYHADVPLLGSSYISQYFLMQLAKSEGVTVAIDGQGADEYLGGYLHSFYRIIGQNIASLKIPKALGLLSALSKRENFSAGKTADYLLKSAISSCSDEEGMYNLEYGQWQKFSNKDLKKMHFEDKTSDKFNNFLYHLLINTTLQSILHHEDRNSMAFSIESRVPFLDHRLVEFAFTLSTEDRVNNKAETKYILREGLKDILPEKVYARKDKKGFVTPGEIKWLNGPLKFLLDIDFKKMDWLKTAKLQQVVEEYKNGNTGQAKFVWRIACLDYWLKNFN